MKTRRQASATIGAAMLALAVLPALACAQGISLAVGNTVPVADVFGRHLPGTNGDPDNSCPVEIRQVLLGGILAPTHESLEAFNPLVTNSYLGRGVVGDRPGLYAETFMDRSVLATNVPYYARVFDRPPAQAPVYYADTPSFFLPPDTEPSINREFEAWKLVATGTADVDTDGDGIPDGMELDLGLDANSPDSDGDGYNDWFEAFWQLEGDYLNPGEADAPLEIRINAPEEPGTEPRTVSWWTIPVPGMTYQLQFRPWLPDDTAYSNVWSTVATETNVEYDVESLIQTDSPVKGFFRVVIP